MRNFLKKVKRLDPFKIIQFSPVRSGSTLIFNILQEIFPNRYIKKEHGVREKYKRYRMVVSYRNPLDCIVSSLTLRQVRPTLEILEERVRHFNQQGGEALLKVRNWDNVLLLKYENFVNDFEYIYENFEDYFNIVITQDMRSELTDKYKIDSVKKILPSGDDFHANYDEETKWHAKHISHYKGQPEYYKSFFSDDQIVYLEEMFEEYLRVFGYK